MLERKYYSVDYMNVDEDTKGYGSSTRCILFVCRHNVVSFFPGVWVQDPVTSYVFLLLSTRWKTNFEQQGMY